MIPPRRACREPVPQPAGLTAGLLFGCRPMLPFPHTFPPTIPPRRACRETTRCGRVSRPGPRSGDLTAGLLFGCRPMLPSRTRFHQRSHRGGHAGKPSHTLRAGLTTRPAGWTAGLLFGCRPMLPSRIRFHQRSHRGGHAGKPHVAGGSPDPTRGVDRRSPLWVPTNVADPHTFSPTIPPRRACRETVPERDRH